jgi:hypothetical protein
MDGCVCARARARAFHSQFNTLLYQIIGIAEVSLRIMAGVVCLTDDFWGTRWRSLLRHCAARRKVTGSIPDAVIAIIV